MAKRRAHGEGSIYQRRSDGRWVAKLPVRNPYGQVKPVYRYRKTRNEALRALRELVRKYEDGTDLTALDPRLDKFLGQWLHATARQRVKERTWEGYKSIIKSRINPRIGHLKLSQITPEVVQLLYVDLLDGGLAPQSVLNTHGVLRQALDQAFRRSMVQRNPCDMADAPKAKRREMLTLTAEQVTGFLNATREDRYHPVYALAVSTGMRLGELLGLKWSDINLDGRRLSVQRSLQRVTGRGLVFTDPKTAKSRRTIVLSTRAVDALREHRRSQAEERLAYPGEWEMPELVFTTERGSPLDPGNVSNGFKTKLGHVGLPVVRFHDLRHTAATLLLQVGTHVKLVSEMLGHSSIVITLDTYSHVLPTMHDEIADTMDQILGVG